MAVLQSGELQIVRNECAKVVPVNYVKAQINAASQAVEDFLSNNATAVSTAINNATSPFVFSAAQKKAIVAWVVFCKYLRDK